MKDNKYRYTFLEALELNRTRAVSPDFWPDSQGYFAPAAMDHSNLAEYPIACIKAKWRVEPQIVSFTACISAYGRTNGDLQHVKFDEIKDERGAYLVKEGSSFERVKVTIELLEG